MTWQQHSHCCQVGSPVQPSQLLLPAGPDDALSEVRWAGISQPHSYQKAAPEKWLIRLQLIQEFMLELRRASLMLCFHFPYETTQARQRCQARTIVVMPCPRPCVTLGVAMWRCQSIEICNGYILELLREFELGTGRALCSGPWKIAFDLRIHQLPHHQQCNLKGYKGFPDGILK